LDQKARFLEEKAQNCEEEFSKESSVEYIQKEGEIGGVLGGKKRRAKSSQFDYFLWRAENQFRLRLLRLRLLQFLMEENWRGDICEVVEGI
jgi:hypothetical protein